MENLSTSSGNDTNTSHFGGSRHRTRDIFKVVKLIVAIIVTVLIICNNTINMFVLRKMRDINTRMKVLLFSLSISDFCLGVMVCVPAVVSGILGYWPFSATACQITGTMNGVAIAVSLWSLMAISLERFMLLRKISSTQNDKSIKRVVYGVIFIWVFNVTFFAFPIFLEDDYIYYRFDPDVMSCSFRWKSSVYFIIAKIVYPVMSGSVILISNIRIHGILKQAQAFRKKILSRPGNSFNQATSDAPGCPRNETGGKRRFKKRVDVQTSSNFCCDTVMRTQVQRDDQRIHVINDIHSGQSKIQSEQRPGAEYKHFHFSLVTTQRRESLPGSCKDQQKNAAVDSKLGCDGRKIKMEGGDRNDNSQKLMPRSVIRRNLKAGLLLFFTSVFFFITTTPYMVSSLIDHFLVNWEMPPGLKFAALWILMTNSFINVYVYSAIYGEFRAYCRNIINIIVCRSCDSSDPTIVVFSDSESEKRGSQRDKSANGSRHDSSPRDNNSKRMDHGSTDLNQSVIHVGQNESHVLIPRNDAGVLYGLPSLSDSRSNNNYLNVTQGQRSSTATTAANSLHVGILPSVDV